MTLMFSWKKMVCRKGAAIVPMLRCTASEVLRVLEVAGGSLIFLLSVYYTDSANDRDLFSQLWCLRVCQPAVLYFLFCNTRICVYWIPTMKTSAV
jgi:hypothetical protein